MCAPVPRTPASHAAGAIIVLTGWTLADPIISVGIGALILMRVWRLVRDAVDVLLELHPSTLPWEKWSGS